MPINDQSLAVFHDYFSIRGGGERLVLDLARALDAELFYGYRRGDSFPVEYFPAERFSLGSAPSNGLRGVATLVLKRRFSGQRERAARYAVRVFSGVTSLFAAPDVSGSGVNIFYCHTPPRFLYDQKDFFLKRTGLLRKLGMAIVGPRFQREYERAVSRMDVIVANSENIRKRIKTYLGRESVVVYPPVDTVGFCWGEQKGYYLSTARLTPLKRIRTIVEAFLTMPDRQLVVASGGEQEAELRALAAGAPNIRFTGWTEDAEIKGLVAGAIATIYIPIEEDFGMSPVESMAAGKPVIGVAEGGLLETIVPDETGILLPPDPSAGDVARAVGRLTPERAREMRDACEARAQLFTREHFLAGMRQVIADAKRAKGIVAR